MTLTAQWIDGGREPQCPPNPEYPSGKDMDLSQGLPACSIVLPCPAKRCGLYVIRCDVCGLTTGVTTAGRPDDPRKVTLACKWQMP